MIWTQPGGAWDPEVCSSGVRVRVQSGVKLRAWSGVRVQSGVRIKSQIVIKVRDIESLGLGLERAWSGVRGPFRGRLEPTIYV